MFVVFRKFMSQYWRALYLDMPVQSIDMAHRVWQRRYVHLENLNIKNERNLSLLMVLLPLLVLGSVHVLNIFVFYMFFYLFFRWSGRKRIRVYLLVLFLRSLFYLELKTNNAYIENRALTARNQTVIPLLQTLPSKLYLTRTLLVYWLFSFYSFIA